MWRDDLTRAVSAVKALKIEDWKLEIEKCENERLHHFAGNLGLCYLALTGLTVVNSSNPECSDETKPAGARTMAEAEIGWQVGRDDVSESAD